MSFNFFESPTSGPASMPPLDERLAAAAGVESTDQYFTHALNEARQGEFAAIPGTAGFFAGLHSTPSDRTHLEQHFAAHGFSSPYSILDLLARRHQQEMPAADFYRFGDETAIQKAVKFLASAGRFALVGTQAEIHPDEYQGSSREQYRQLWVPHKDDHGQLPIYTRFTGPAQDTRSRQRSHLSQDWMLLPRLIVPASPEVPQANTASPMPPAPKATGQASVPEQRSNVVRLDDYRRRSA